MTDSLVDATIVRSADCHKKVEVGGQLEDLQGVRASVHLKPGTALRGSFAERS